MTVAGRTSLCATVFPSDPWRTCPGNRLPAGALLPVAHVPLLVRDPRPLCYHWQCTQGIGPGARTWRGSFIRNRTGRSPCLRIADSASTLPTLDSDRAAHRTWRTRHDQSPRIGILMKRPCSHTLLLVALQDFHLTPTTKPSRMRLGNAGSLGLRWSRNRVCHGKGFACPSSSDLVH